MCVDARTETAGKLAVRKMGESPEMNDKPEILTREEVLWLLSQKAREGTTSAMIALEGRCDLRPTPASTTSLNASSTRADRDG